MVKHTTKITHCCSESNGLTHNKEYSLLQREQWSNTQQRVLTAAARAMVLTHNKSTHCCSESNGLTHNKEYSLLQREQRSNTQQRVLTAAARAMPMPLQMMAYQQPRERKQTVTATAKMMAGRAYSELPVLYTVCT